MRSEEEWQKALRLIDEGVNDSAIGRELGIPRRTVREWRVGLRTGSGGRTESWSGKRASACFRCTGGFVDEEAYTYLLGVYLGDGYLTPHPRGVYRLRISCDLRYPEIINEIATHIVIVRGTDTVGFASRTGCVDVNAYWKHWFCLFPQHGPGRKHERRIKLASCQQALVATNPKAMIRGLIQSDGSRHINEVTRTLASGPKRYQYPRYIFTNASEDILEIFTATLDTLGIDWTRTTARDVSVARRDDVAFVDTFVGPKL